MNDVTTGTTATYPFTEPETVCEAVVSTVARAGGVSPLDLEPLARTVDPDALEAFVDSVGDAPGDATAAVEFAYAGYDVTVAGDGGVSIAARD